MESFDTTTNREKAGKDFDVIIIGGGLAGCTLASRLHSLKPSQSIAVIEAGPDVSEHPLTRGAWEGARLLGSELDWNYSTEKQKYLNNRRIGNSAGKALGGGSAINVSGWIRGSAFEYDSWAALVQSPRWSYESQLPYMRRVEHYPEDGSLSKTEHGFDGPMFTQTPSSSGRHYPLREVLKAAWAEAGVDFIKDANSGHPKGLAEFVENRRDGLRQIASSVYPLDGVTVLTNRLAEKVLISEENGNKVATGVLLADGTQLTAQKQIVVCGGAYRTPQILLLSGIGPAEDLNALGIPLAIDSPHVGKNLHDHLMVNQWWRLRHPEANLSLGAADFFKPAHANGFPVDWLVDLSVDRAALKAALEKDIPGSSDNHPILQDGRVHVEAFCTYAAINTTSDEGPSMDGTHVTTSIASLTPTSRGSITIQSKDPAEHPVIDPCYFATEVDRCVMREGIRTTCRVMLETKAGKETFSGEWVKEGRQALTPESDDAAIDEVIRDRGMTIYQAAGTAAMGKVVDTELKVKGVGRLRVVDASVLPLPLSGHYQVPVYALAEQAAEMISADI